MKNNGAFDGVFDLVDCYNQKPVLGVGAADVGCLQAELKAAKDKIEYLEWALDGTRNALRTELHEPDGLELRAENEHLKSLVESLGRVVHQLSCAINIDSDLAYQPEK